MITQALAGRDGEGPGGIDPFGFARLAPAPAPRASAADLPTQVLGRRLAAPPVPGRRPLAAPPRPGRPRPGPPQSRPRPAPPPGPRRRSRAVLAVTLAAGLLVAGGGVAVAVTHVLTGRAGVVDESLGFTLPRGWTRVAAAPGTTAGGITLDTVATVGGYTCQGGRHFRATAGHAFVVRGDGVGARTEDAARDFGPLFAGSFYGPGSTTTPGPTSPVTVGTRTGTVSQVQVTPAAGGCPARGVVTVLALPTDRRGPGGASGVLLLVLQRDTAGGPGTPAPVAGHAAEALLDSVRVVTGSAERRPA